MPLSDDFLLTQMTIDLVDGPRSRASLTVDPDDVMARGLDVTFLNVRQTVDMSDATVSLYWQHDVAPALRGLEPFEAIDASIGRWKVYWPSAMGQSAGTVTGKIMVAEDGRTIAIPLPVIRVPGDRADPSATPNEDTFSVLAELLDAYREGIGDVTEWTDAAREAAGNADVAAEGANASAAKADEAAARADAVVDGAQAAANRANASADAADAATEAATGAAAIANDMADLAEAAAADAADAADAANEAAGTARSATSDMRELSDTVTAQEAARVEAEAKRVADHSAEMERHEAEFQAAQTRRSDDYDAKSAQWTGAEETRQTQFEAAQATRETQFGDAQDARDAAFDAQRQTFRREHDAAEAEHERQFGDAQDARAKGYEDAEADRESRVQAAIDAAEAATAGADESAARADASAAGADESAAGADEAADAATRATSDLEGIKSTLDADEAARKEAEEGRVAADLDREQRQAKNDSDQAQNNLAAQGRLTRILKDGEFDPETRVPTIEGDLTHVFAVPNAEAEAAEARYRAALEEVRRVEREQADAGIAGPSFEGQASSAAAALAEAQAAYESANRYVEWLWLLDPDTGEGYWELYGTSSTMLPDPITTDEYDRMWAGETVENKHIAEAMGQSYNVAKARAALSDAVSGAVEGITTAQTERDEGQDSKIAEAKAAADAAQAAADAASEAATAGDQSVRDWVTGTAKAHSAASADTAATADTLGADDVGGPTVPIYLAKGVPSPVAKVAAAAKADSADAATTATTATRLGADDVGSASQPIYLSKGAPTPVTKVGASASADRLAATRSITTDLGSEAAADFDGSADATPGVKGVLGPSHGGTGKATLKEAGTALATALDAADVAIDDAHYLVTATATTASRTTGTQLWTALEPKVKSTKVDAATEATALDTDLLIPSSGDLNDYRGSSHWGRTYYATGGNKVQNRPAGVDAFGLVVGRAASGWSYQLLFSSNGGETVWYRRGDDAAALGAWKQIYPTADVTGYVKLSDLDDLLKSHVETIREAIGPATEDRPGLVPELPPEAEDTGYLYLSSRGGWSDPMMGSGSIIAASAVPTAKWQDIDFTARAAAASPSQYSGFVGQQRTFVLDGTTVTARIIGVGQDKLEDGRLGGFTFEVYKGLHRHRAHNTYIPVRQKPDGGTERLPLAGPSNYATSELREYVEGLAWPSEMARYMRTFEVLYNDATEQEWTYWTEANGTEVRDWIGSPPPVHKLYAKAAPLSLSNIVGTSALNWSTKYIQLAASNQGARYTWYQSSDRTRRIHYETVNGSDVAVNIWTTTQGSPYDYAQVGGIQGSDSEGNAVTCLSAGFPYFAPSIRFVIGAA